MTKLWKISMLMLLLAIPAMAYMFLQIFGENKFDVPIYYTNGIENPVGDCGYSSSQHHISKDLYENLDLYNESEPINQLSIKVFSFLSADCDDTCQLKFNQLSRIANYFVDEQNLKFVSLVNQQDVQNQEMQLIRTNTKSNWFFVNIKENELKKFVQCGLILCFDNASLNQFILVDDKNRIRGYYEGYDVGEVDRLITEIRILLNNYYAEQHEQNNS